MKERHFWLLRASNSLVLSVDSSWTDEKRHDSPTNPVCRSRVQYEPEAMTSAFNLTFEQLSS